MKRPIDVADDGNDDGSSQKQRQDLPIKNEEQHPETVFQPVSLLQPSHDPVDHLKLSSAPAHIQLQLASHATLPVSYQAFITQAAAAASSASASQGQSPDPRQLADTMTAAAQLYHHHQQQQQQSQQHPGPTTVLVPITLSPQQHGAAPGIVVGAAGALSREEKRTTSAKRALQNREAQRAFRERKQNYIRSLEAKAADLDSYIQERIRYQRQEQDYIRLQAERETWLKEREELISDRNQAWSQVELLKKELQLLHMEIRRLTGLDPVALVANAQLNEHEEHPLSDEGGHESEAAVNQGEMDSITNGVDSALQSYSSLYHQQPSTTSAEDSSIVSVAAMESANVAVVASIVAAAAASAVAAANQAQQGSSNLHHFPTTHVSHDSIFPQSPLDDDDDGDGDGDGDDDDDDDEADEADDGDDGDDVNDTDDTHKS
ncbi:uncharacterized protein BJ171DRAFT_505944 [Polychytrium aggregatum]|uniref:uncharacterized protein n=1 Tax=Polychytrium aggregatum TaxID=110093 RepID=UPI0022FDDB5B|nr:uncharacterized protein BJ171DRAFT_505944 [Polychytrium aggregatum]KAI9204491.1 hypothetical protein BJ171DRAFT_505944 [Polychytrium aggregatum]